MNKYVIEWTEKHSTLIKAENEKGASRRFKDLKKINALIDTLDDIDINIRELDIPMKEKIVMA